MSTRCWDDCIKPTSKPQYQNPTCILSKTVVYNHTAMHNACRLYGSTVDSLDMAVQYGSSMGYGCTVCVWRNNTVTQALASFTPDHSVQLLAWWLLWDGLLQWGRGGCEATDTQLPYDPRDTGHRSSPTTLFCCTAALFVHRHSIVRRSPHSALPMAPISCTATAWASSLSCPHLIPLRCGTPPSSLSPCHTSQAFPAVPTPPRYPALIFVS